ncbi:MAG: hypothetical protein ACXVCO_12830, partial [Ktedonobacterales bacterium]
HERVRAPSALIARGSVERATSAICVVVQKPALWMETLAIDRDDGLLRAPARVRRWSGSALAATRRLARMSCF